MPHKKQPVRINTKQQEVQQVPPPNIAIIQTPNTPAKDCPNVIEDDDGELPILINYNLPYPKSSSNITPPDTPPSPRVSKDNTEPPQGCPDTNFS